MLGAFTCSPCVVDVGVDTTAYEGQPSWAELMADTSGSPALAFAWSQVTWSKTSSTVVGMTAEASQGYWLVTASRDRPQFRWGALLRLRHDAAGPQGRLVWQPQLTDTGTGLLPVAAMSSPSETPIEYGSTANVHLAAPIVGITTTSNGLGYWLASSDGGVFCFGNTAFHGSTGAIRLNRPVVGIASTFNGLGYWLVALDGGVFSFGNASFHGSTGGIRLNRPVVGMTPTLDGRGYWMVASDGGIFSFGDATFHGSTGNLHLAAPVVGMASPSSVGYWLVASDGGIFSFGVPYHGSMA